MGGKVTSPFDEVKYKALLEGLEVSIITNSEINKDNAEFRLDTEYYSKEYLELYKKIKFSPCLENLVYMSDLSTNGSFAAVAKIKNDNNSKVVPFIRSGNVGDTFINVNDLELISKEAHLQLPKSTTYLHEIIMARKGKIGGASIITDNEVGFNCSENVIKLRILQKNKLNPFYFTQFFNCKYGLKQVERLSTGNVQPWVSILQIRKLMIPFFSIRFQSRIEEIVLKSHSNLRTSQTLYTTAEVQLLAALGLSDYQPSTENVKVKSLKDSFLKSGRLDAEYYQPKYEEVEKHIRSYIGGWDYLGNRIEKIETGEYSSDYLPKKEGLKFFIRNTNIKNGFIEEAETHFVNPTKFKKFVRPGDILTARVGAIGTFGTVTKDFEGSVFSDNMLKIKLQKGLVSEVYTLYFNSLPNQELMDRIAGGSVQPLVTQTTIKGIIIPIFENNLQTQVSTAIQQSFMLKIQSERLLEIAKIGVEKAIETNELEAMKWMEKEIDNLENFMV